ncbi:MAG: ClpXP protease specificity-enhancing factor SspB [Myxococcota bacterium]
MIGIHIRIMSEDSRSDPLSQRDPNVAATRRDCYCCAVMDMTPSEAKQDLLSRLLEEGMVQVMLDARGRGVDVPTHLRNDYQLRLNLSYRFNNHMEIDRDGVEATLTFKGEPYTCRIPWNCLYMMVLTNNDDPPYIFPADMPAELIHLANQLQDQESPEPAPSERPQLSVVQGEEQLPSESKTDNDSPDDGGDGDPPNPPRRRNHLRVVK